MPQNISQPTANEDVKKLADRINQYETQDKGALGKLFGFEARDGFWSKLVKSVGLVSTAAAATAATFSLIAPVGLAAVAALGAGLASGVISRAAYKSVFKELHDSNRSNMGKIGHYLAAGLSAGMVVGAAMVGIEAASGGLNAASSLALETVSSYAAAPLLVVGTSMAIGSVMGDQQLRRESTQARDMAQQAIESGQSIEQMLNAGISQAPQVKLEPEQSLEQSNYFTSKLAQERRTGKDLAEHGIG